MRNSTDQHTDEDSLEAAKLGIGNPATENGNDVGQEQKEESD